MSVFEDDCVGREGVRMPPMPDIWEGVIDGDNEGVEGCKGWNVDCKGGKFDWITGGCEIVEGVVRKESNEIL